MRTSETHPLQIATISAGSDMGAVGVTFCPGKIDRHAHCAQSILYCRPLSLKPNNSFQIVNEKQAISNIQFELTNFRRGKRNDSF